MDSNTMIIFWLILIAALGMIGLLIYFLLVDSLRKKTWAPRILDSVFLEISTPKENSDSEQEPKKEEKDIIAIAEQFFSTIVQTEGRDMKHFLGINDYISFEIAAHAKKISFYINVPKRLQVLIEKQLHAQYPKAQIDVVKPYNIFNPKAKVKGAELTLQKDYSYPLRTYKTMESDPINSLTNSLSKLNEEEGAAIQLLISPASDSWQSKPRQYAQKIQQGRNPDVVTSSVISKVLNTALRAIGEGFGEALGIGSTKPQQKPGYYDPSGVNKPLNLTPMQQETIKRFEEKASRMGYKFNLRAVSSSPENQAAETNLRNILSSFMQYSMPPFNGFLATNKSSSQVVTDYVFRVFRNTRAILNTEEVASIWHLPTRFTETPNIKWLSSKKAPPPTNVATSGLLLGRNLYRGQETKIFMSRDDRRRHAYVIGRTGTGKTNLMKNMAIQDIRNGEGVCIVDPHGDFVEDVLRFIPKERADDVILFEPFDMDRPLGLNMLEVKGPEQKDFAIQEMIAIFYKLFPPEMIGPMFEHNMRNVMLTLMEDDEYPGTIADIPRMFTDTTFQKYKVSKVKDPIVRSFWEKEMAKTSDFHKSEMLGYLISKVGRFVENEMMRNIIGQPKSAFDFREVMDQGKILLLNLSKGKTGEVNAKLLGLIMVSKIQMAAMSRADIPEDNRRDFYLYVDEFQNFVTDSFATILSEARKYHLNLIMAHQFISQLNTQKEGSSKQDSQMRDAVFGNAGTMVAFRIGVEDAEIMAKEFAPVFNQFDLVNIDRYNAYIKLMINGTASRPFNMETFPMPTDQNHETGQVVRNLSRLKFGRARSEVQADILERTQLGAPAVTGPADIEKTA